VGGSGGGDLGDQPPDSCTVASGGSAASSGACPGNEPPDCSAAAASIASLWPPNHRLEALSIAGITDPDGDPITIRVNGITSDEAQDAHGSGRTMPDCAGIGTAEPEVRVERAGPGNGRVYAIDAVALDGRGGVCRASVDVCVPHDEGGGVACLDDGQSFECRDCPPEKVCGQQCCPVGSECVDGACRLADIFVDAGALKPCLCKQTFAPNACELQPEEGPCVGGSGERVLLRFTTTTPNVGQWDLFLGNPSDNPHLFSFSTCPGHMHSHFDSFALHQLLDDAGCVVAFGGKRGFCLLGGPRFNCDFQGIGAGYADTYFRTLACQWIDVTDVPPGSYTLRVTVNFEFVLAESDYGNNAAQVPVSIPDSSAIPACPTACLPASP